jgi:hypothetical protein
VRGMSTVCSVLGGMASTLPSVMKDFIRLRKNGYITF